MSQAPLIAFTLNNNEEAVVYVNTWECRIQTLVDMS